jgi:hypothetical protein
VIQSGIDVSDSRKGLIDALAAALLVALVASPIINAVHQQLDRYGAGTTFLGHAHRSTLLQSRINLAAAGGFMARMLPDDARILVIGDARLALMPRRTTLSSAINRPAIDRYIDGTTNAAELETRLSRDFTHVLVNSRELRRWADQYAFFERMEPGAEALLNQCLGGALAPVGRWGDVALYELPRANAK